MIIGKKIKKKIKFDNKKCKQNYKGKSYKNFLSEKLLRQIYMSNK